MNTEHVDTDHVDTGAESDAEDDAEVDVAPDADADADEDPDDIVEDAEDADEEDGDQGAGAAEFAGGSEVTSTDDDDAGESPQANEPSNVTPVEQANLVQAPTDTENTSTATLFNATKTAVRPGEETAATPWSAVVEEFLDDWTARTLAWIDTLQVSDQRKLRMEESFYAMRRTFFNQAPTVDPVQITGFITGPITGEIGADDVDDDRVFFRIVRGPKAGSVRLHADGTYTYTPGADFNGVDTFTVIAIDPGLHVNLLNPFRPWGTRAAPLINQGAIKFDFAYEEASQRHWTQERRDALKTATDTLIWYFRVTKPVILTYAITGYDDPDVNTLAWASASLLGDVRGFHRTRIQDEIITGIDRNGAEPDGTIQVNFAFDWALSDPVGSQQMDFTTTLMHEVLHSFGFAMTFPEQGIWSIYTSFLMSGDGEKFINPDFLPNPALVENVDGMNGGLFFGGANAVAANGGSPIKLFTPTPYRSGSSVSHLDDYTYSGDDIKLMNAMLPSGTIIRKLSTIEIGILKDLGYNAVPLPQDD